MLVRKQGKNYGPGKTENVDVEVQLKKKNWDVWHLSQLSPKHTLVLQGTSGKNRDNKSPKAKKKRPGGRRKWAGERGRSLCTWAELGKKTGGRKESCKELAMGFKKGRGGKSWRLKISQNGTKCQRQRNSKGGKLKQKKKGWGLLSLTKHGKEQKAQRVVGQ